MNIGTCSGVASFSFSCSVPHTHTHSHTLTHTYTHTHTLTYTHTHTCTCTCTHTYTHTHTRAHTHIHTHTHTHTRQLFLSRSLLCSHVRARAVSLLHSLFPSRACFPSLPLSPISHSLSLLFLALSPWRTNARSLSLSFSHPSDFVAARAVGMYT